jgi:ADP-ribosyl-[dinitrogen reductase] hydrolase
MNSIYGALVGDAAGATLEFFNDDLTKEVVQNAMKMPGGGRNRIGPGQITDDGELTLALWRALNSITDDDIPLDAILKYYADWYNSIPFDIGMTCSNAFEIYADYLNEENYSSINECLDAVKDINVGSEANGALMRASAISPWTIQNKKSVDFAVECAMIDARLSHPSIVCQEVNAIYVFAIYHLLSGYSPTHVINLTNEFVNNRITSDKVKQWYFEESLNINDINARKQIGHVRWGFVMAIYFLRNPHITYEEAIKITLLKGGDTDTNAAIVGGMVGSYHNIPEYMLRPVLEFDSTLKLFKGHMRPAEYCVKHVLGKLI